jgi:hypothetical protein
VEAEGRKNQRSAKRRNDVDESGFGEQEKKDRRKNKKRGRMNANRVTNEAPSGIQFEVEGGKGIRRKLENGKEKKEEGFGQGKKEDAENKGNRER